jgi:hypothetical protein
MAARETGLTSAAAEEDIDTLKKDIRGEEAELAQTISEIRARVSYGALKNMAKAEAREVAIEKPKQIARSAAGIAYRFILNVQKAAREYPILPLVMGIVVLTPIVVRRIAQPRDGKKDKAAEARQIVACARRRT